MIKVDTNLSALKMYRGLVDSDQSANSAVVRLMSEMAAVSGDGTRSAVERVQIRKEAVRPAGSHDRVAGVVKLDTRAAASTLSHLRRVVLSRVYSIIF